MRVVTPAARRHRDRRGARGGRQRSSPSPTSATIRPASGTCPGSPPRRWSRSLPGAAIDAEVRRLRDAGQAVITVDAEALRRLAPDLLITQDLCEVCAVADGSVHRLAAASIPPRRCWPSAGARWRGSWRTSARSRGRSISIRSGDELTAGLRSRLARLRRGAPPAPPPGTLHRMARAALPRGPLGARPGRRRGRARRRRYRGRPLREGVVGGRGGSPARPHRRDALRVRTRRARGRSSTALTDADALRALGSAPVWLLDGNAYTSRPGPRVVDGAERLQSAMRGVERPGLARWQPRR